MDAKAFRIFVAGLVIVVLLATLRIAFGGRRDQVSTSLTIFAAVPRLHGFHHEAQLYGALKSWSMLSPMPRIYLLGDDEYTHSSVSNIDIHSLGAEYFQVMQYTDFDDPRFSVMIHQMLALSKTELVVLAPPTTVLTQAFLSAVRACVRLFPADPGFIMVGDGHVLQTKDAAIFEQPDWFSSLVQPCLACYQNPSGSPTLADRAPAAPPIPAATNASLCSTCSIVHNATVLAFPRSIFKNQSLPDLSLSHPTGVAYLLGHLQGRNVPLVHAKSTTEPYIVTQQDEMLLEEVEDEIGTYNQDLATEHWPGLQPAFKYTYVLQNTSALDPGRVNSYFRPTKFSVVAEEEEHVVQAIAPEGEGAYERAAAATTNQTAREEKVDEKENEMEQYIVPDGRFQKEDSQTTYGESELADTVDLSKEYDGSRFTVFATPKPMTDPHIAMIQTNAIRSWARLQPKPDIIIFGAEEGLDKLAATVGAKYIPRVKVLDEKSRGVHSSHPVTPTPAMGSLFYQAMSISTTKSLVFINADIMLPPVFGDLLMTVSNATDRFLMMSHRYRQWVREYIDFSNPLWYMDSFGKCEKHGAFKNCTWTRDSSRAVDYFAFTRETWAKVRLLEFAVGRPAYDNWLVSKAALSSTPIISATEVMRSLHQNHNYKHITAAATSSEKYITGKNAELFSNPLADYNRRIIAFKEKEGLLVIRGDQRFNTFKMRQTRKDCRATKYVSHGCSYQVVRVRPNQRLQKYMPTLGHPKFHCKHKHLCITHVQLPSGT